jgi:hypothetical protein
MALMLHQTVGWRIGGWQILFLCNAFHDPGYDAEKIVSRPHLDLGRSFCPSALRQGRLLMLCCV